MSEYIRTNKFDTNECPNIFVKEKLTQTNVRIYIRDQYIRIFEYIRHTLLWCSTVATYGISLDSGVLLCTCGESPVQVYCNSCVYCGSVVLLWCLHWFVNCATLVFHWGTTVKFTVVLLWCVNCGVSLWWVQCASSQVCPGLLHPCSSTRHTVDQV